MIPIFHKSGYNQVKVSENLTYNQMVINKPEPHI